MLYPTLVIGLPSWGHHLVERVKPLWEERLGERVLALEVASLEAWHRGIRHLRSLPRVTYLERQGFPVDPTLNLVILAQAKDQALIPLCQEIEEAFSSGPYRGLELRLHLVLFLRDSADFQALEAFTPDRNYPLACRVWPLSLWSRNGLHLPKEEHLSLWVQHFVEALVLNSNPLGVHKGRDWVGLGIARLERHRPGADQLAPWLWEIVQQITLAPPPDLPPPPTPPPLSLSWPKAPERRSCETFPDWSGGVWDSFRRDLREKGEASLEKPLLPWEESLPLEYGRQALLRGIPSLRAALPVLDKALEEGAKAQERILEELDGVMGLQGKRARLARLETRRLRGRPVDPEEIRKLQEALASVDRALEEADVLLFLERDGEALKAKDELDKLRQDFEGLREQWEVQVGSPPPSPPPNLWQRIRLWWAKVWGRKPITPKDVETPSRKRLCDRAWAILREAHGLEETYTQRYLHYLNRWREVVLLYAYQYALRRERERARAALARIETFSVPLTAAEENPLVVRLPAESIPQVLLRETAKALVTSGALEAFWDGDEVAFRQALLEHAGKLAQQIPPVRVGAVPEEVWSALVLAAAPRVPIRNWPEHRQYAYVLGHAGQQRWGEPREEMAWFPGETVLMRMVYPLAPEHLLLEVVEGLPPEPPPPTSAEPAEPPPELRREREAEVVRGNPLIDELLEVPHE